jgi:uncharacterized membrane protein
VSSSSDRRARGGRDSSGNPGGPGDADGTERPAHRPGPSLALVRDERTLFAQVRSSQDKTSDAITSFAGSMTFIYLHIAWFGFWIVDNEGAFGQATVFDRYPFGLLTMIVSLEAIFLSTFVMISQNRSAQRDNLRSALDFETNLRSEVWSIHIGKALGLDAAEIERHVQEIIAASEKDLDDGLRTSLDPRTL